jgi:hypothetical protein
VSSPPPQSDVNPDEFTRLEDYAAALLQERSLRGISPQETHSRADNEEVSIEEVSTQEIDRTNGWMIRKAAWFAFVQIITGDRKTRIAKCVEPDCESPYFRLGKLNTEKKAERCASCRKRTLEAHRRSRVEKERDDAEKEVLSFVAKNFREEIDRNPAGWYTDRRVKKEIKAATTSFILASRPAVKNRFRGKVTERWIVSGQGGEKNWNKVLRVLEATKSCN